MTQNLSQLIEKANRLFAQEKYRRAQKLYEQALKLSPEDPIINFNLGALFQAQGDDEQAQNFYAKAPGSADAKNNLGIIYKEQGDLAKAKECYLAALEIDPNQKNAKENLETLEEDKIKKQSDVEKKPTTINNIPEETQESIRKSFGYRGLLKALKNKIVVREDIAIEAQAEQKNKKLLIDQRVHTVLLADLEQGKVEKKEPENSNQSPISSSIPDDLKARSLSPKEQENLLTKLSQKFGPDFKVRFKGVDDDGDLIEITRIAEDGWISFTVEKPTSEIDSYSYPLDKFLAEIKKNSLYQLTSEEAQSLAANNLKKLDDKTQTDLMQEVHTKTMARLQNIGTQQRSTLEDILKKDEQKKLEQTLSKIRES